MHIMDMIHTRWGTYTVRPYDPEDREHVLRLFRLNTPVYFDPAEENDLARYLDQDIYEYYVITSESDQIIGSGGCNIADDGRIGILSWDIIDPECQGHGIGRFFTSFRLGRFQDHTSIERVRVRTSQHVFRFYEKMGFALFAVFPDYWASGIDMYVMERGV